jgi:uncharacterized iron-regulated membrane protein
MKAAQISPQKLRNLVFQLHRYLGLVVGLILVLVGLTGSLLVFHAEIEAAMVERQFGVVQPQENPVSIDRILAVAQAELRDRPDLKIGSLVPPKDATHPYQARIWDEKNNQLSQIFIHPYTGQVMGKFVESANVMQIALRLHYQLAAGDIGTQIVGVAALLLVILSLTGIVLWPGWRKLATGFTIKWDAHPKRLNFDLHKVAGIVAVIFLLLTAFTGFCWNFYDISYPAIYALTLTPKLPDPVSKPISNQTPVQLSQILLTAEAAFPNAKTAWISLPTKPEAVFTIYKQRPNERNNFDNAVYLDQFTGQVVRVSDGQKQTLGDRVLNSFVPLHYGTFWGLPSRILYVFVGLAPLVLFITGLVMWWHRKRKQPATAAIAHKSASTPS